VHPEGGEKIGGGGAKFTGESCKCIPKQSKSPFLGNLGDLGGGVVNLVVLACGLTKKGRQLFGGRKVHTQRKS